MGHPWFGGFAEIDVPEQSTPALAARGRKENYGITAVAWLESALSSPPESTAVAT